MVDNDSVLSQRVYFLRKQPVHLKVILSVYENTFTAVLTVHVRPMYIVCLDVLSAVGESSYGLVISVTSNAY